MLAVLPARRDPADAGERAGARIFVVVLDVGDVAELTVLLDLTEFVKAFADTGVTDFMFGLSAARASLEKTAASLESLRAVA
jgi:hypothetical protein